MRMCCNFKKLTSLFIFETNFRQHTCWQKVSALISELKKQYTLPNGKETVAETVYKVVRMLDVVVHSSSIVYSSSQEKFCYLKIWLDLLKALVHTYRQKLPHTAGACRPCTYQPPKQFSQRNFTVKFIPIEEKARLQRKCVACTMHQK
jgi:hypothetical protein